MSALLRRVSLLSSDSFAESARSLLLVNPTVDFFFIDVSPHKMS